MDDRMALVGVEGDSFSTAVFLFERGKDESVVRAFAKRLGLREDIYSIVNVDEDGFPQWAKKIVEVVKGNDGEFILQMPILKVPKYRPYQKVFVKGGSVEWAVLAWEVNGKKVRYLLNRSDRSCSRTYDKWWPEEKIR